MWQESRTASSLAQRRKRFAAKQTSATMDTYGRVDLTESRGHLGVPPSRALEWWRRAAPLGEEVNELWVFRHHQQGQGRKVGLLGTHSK